VLRGAGSHFRLKRQGSIEASKSPWVTLRHTLTNKERSIKGCRWDDSEHVEQATEFLKKANNNTPLADLAHRLIVLFNDSSVSPSQEQKWGEIRRLVKGWIAPSGDKARDPNPFKCFKDNSYFGRNFDDDEPATTRELRRYCLHTTESLQAHLDDPTQPLIPREYNARPFQQAIQMVNRLADYEVSIATRELQDELKHLKRRAGKRKPPNPRFNPRDEDVEAWIQKLAAEGYPLRSWFFALQATYGLRSHEVWHLQAFPGESTASATSIRVANFEGSEDGSGWVKTGARPVLACKAEWVELFGLDNVKRNRQLMAQLHSRWPVKTATRKRDGVEVVINNSALGIYVSHWLKNKGREDIELPVKLMGYYRPPSVSGKKTPKEKKGQSSAYDLRHAWALRAGRLTTWSTKLKADSMGHSESTHRNRYLVGVTMEAKEEAMKRQLAHDEGKAQEKTTTAEVKVVEKLPEGVTPELIALARQLADIGVLSSDPS